MLVLLEKSGLRETVSEELVGLIVPLLLCGIAYYLIYRRLPIRDDSQDRLRDALCIPVILGTLIACLQIQHLLDASYSRTVTLHTMADVERSEDADYYRFDVLDADTSQMMVYHTVCTVHKRHGSDIELTSLFVFPIRGTRHSYFGVSYKALHDYSFSSMAKIEAWYEATAQLHQQYIRSYSLDEVRSCQRLHEGNEMYRKFEHSIAENMVEPRGARPRLYVQGEVPSNQSFTDGMKYVLLILAGVMLYASGILLSKRTHRRYLYRRRGKRQASSGNADTWRQFLRQPSSWYIIGPPMVMALYTLAMVLGGVSLFRTDTESLIVWGAGSHSLIIVDGEWWRLLSCIFVHDGVAHLTGNLVAYALAVFLMLFGRFRPWHVAMCFMLSALTGSMVCAVFADYTFVGASSGVMGLYGLLTMSSLTSGQGRERHHTLLYLPLGVIGLTLLGSLLTGVSMLAHVSGVVAGLVIGGIEYLLRQDYE